MIKYSFFKNKQPKGFQFKPRYYNAEKEAFDARVRAAQIEADSNSSTVSFDSEVMRLRMRKQWGTSSSAKANRQSNIRIVWIAALLALGFYIFLFTDFDKLF